MRTTEYGTRRVAEGRKGQGLADQSLRNRGDREDALLRQVARSAYWLNIDPTGMVEAVYRPELK